MSLRRQDLVGDILRIVQRIALMSHAPIQGYNFAPSEVGRGQRWRTSDARPPVAHLGQHQAKRGGGSPPGGEIDRRGDAAPEFRQKSHVYLQRRLARARTDDQLRDVLEEAKQILGDWMRTPSVAGVEPERGSFAWKVQIANDERDDRAILAVYSISRSSLWRYRQKYRGLRAFTP